MYTLIAENQYGDQLQLTQNPDYTITSIDGLNPPPAIINTVQRAGHDGSMFNSAVVDNRQLIINLVINGNVCQNRNNLYKYFQTARPTRLYYFNDVHGVYLDGWCQNAPVEFFAKKQNVQITLFCPDPFWHSTVPVVGKTDGIESLFEFPFSINEGEPIPFSENHGDHGAYIWNPGTIESGIAIRIKASGTVTNPRIWHANTDKYFKVNTSLSNGDILIINTRTDEKAIERIRSGAKTNLISNRDLGSTWLEAVPGNNLFVFSAEFGVNSCTCEITIISNVEGV